MLVRYHEKSVEITLICTTYPLTTLTPRTKNIYSVAPFAIVVYCSEESSKSKFADEENKKDNLIWYIVIAGVSALAVGAITYFVVGYIERKKGCK